MKKTPNNRRRVLLLAAGIVLITLGVYRGEADAEELPA